MAHSSLQVANQFLEKAEGRGLTPMQLLKLTYLAQGWMLGLYGEPLVWDDVEAWRYGPVFRRIYNQVAGKQTVERLEFPDREDTFDSREKDLIDQVWKIYGALGGLTLSALTHEKGSPWDVTYHERGQNSVIPKDLLKEYYAKKAA